MKDLYPSNYLFDARNILGYQVYRMIREKNSSISIVKQNKKHFEKYIDIDKGYGVHENTLDKKSFEQLYKIFQNKINMELEESRISISPKDEEYELLIKLFSTSKLNEIFKLKPLIEFERIIISNKDVDDHNKRWHADRFVDCYKMFYFLNDHSQNNGTYEYSEGSHKINFYRCLLEYYTSIRYLFSRISLGKITTYSIFPSKFFAELICKKKIMLYPKNTMIISNNKGYHRRGNMKPNQIREQVNFTFYHNL